MKSAFILILLSGSLSGYAQVVLKMAPIKPITGNKQFEKKPLIGNQLKRNEPLNNYKPINRNLAMNNNEGVEPGRIIAPGVYPLGPDNMPCVVPDMARVKSMPNRIKEGDKIPFIPNGYRRTPIILDDKKHRAQPR